MEALVLQSISPGLHRRSAPLLIALASTALLLAGPAPADASPGKIISPVRGAILRSGQSVAVEWRSLPRSADEMELLLILDDSAETSLRLTRQLSPLTRSYLWQVPNLPGRRARLVLRFGNDGKEQECEPSEPFTIVPDRSEPLAAIGFHDGEWWLSKRLGAAPGCGVSGDRARIGELQEVHTVALTPSYETNGAGREQHGSRAVSVKQGKSPHPMAAYGLPRQPLSIPLRP